MTDTQNSPINAALASLQADLPTIAKDQMANAGTYRYKYADLADVSRAIMPLLGKHGLSFTSRPTLHEGRFVLLYELRHESGDQIPGIYPLPERGSPQEIGGQITYARRYCLCAVTGVAPEDDDDDAAAAQRASTRREERRERREGGQHNGQGAREPGITGDQQRQLTQLYRALGIEERAAKVQFAASVVKRDLKSATELTQAEALKVIKAGETAVAKRAQQVAPEVHQSERAPAADSDPDGEKWLASQQPPEGAR